MTDPNQGRACPDCLVRCRHWRALEAKANEFCQDAATREMDNHALKAKLAELLSPAYRAKEILRAIQAWDLGPRTEGIENDMRVFAALAALEVDQ